LDRELLLTVGLTAPPELPGADDEEASNDGEADAEHGNHARQECAFEDGPTRGSATTRTGRAPRPNGRG